MTYNKAKVKRSKTIAIKKIYASEHSRGFSIQSTENKTMHCCMWAINFDPQENAAKLGLRCNQRCLSIFYSGEVAVCMKQFVQQWKKIYSLLMALKYFVVCAGGSNHFRQNGLESNPQKRSTAFSILKHFFMWNFGWFMCNLLPYFFVFSFSQFLT